MRHQRSERQERQERQERGSHGRHQNRSVSGRPWGRQGRGDEPFGRWQDQDRDESRDENRDFRGQSYRSDDYDMLRSDRDYDYGSREYQGLGSSSQTSRDINQGYSSSYGSRDLDFGSSESTGWGRGASEEESSLVGERSRGGAQIGRFMGRGPKGYKRSDERIKEDICEVLTRAPQVDASDIEVEVKEGEVTLTGFVPERKMKHLAEDVVEKCMGVKDVTNNLRLRREEGRGEGRETREAREASASSTSSGVGQAAGSKRSGGTSTSVNPSH